MSLSKDELIYFSPNGKLPPVALPRFVASFFLRLQSLTRISTNKGYLYKSNFVSSRFAACLFTPLRNNTVLLDKNYHLYIKKMCA